MKVIIIDDESKARNLLRTILEENCPSIEVCFEAKDLITGVEIIKSESPAIVFLDIEMPEYSGLDILEFFSPSEINFEIIFTTAYNKYALQAFKLSAVDYLLKPMRPRQVIEAFNKASGMQRKSLINDKLEELKKSLEHGSFSKIALPVNDGIKFVNFNEIILLEADGMYTKITTTAETAILISKPLKHFIEILGDMPFFYKPHRSFLINLKFLKKYVKSDGGYLIMDNDQIVSITRDNKEEFVKLIQTL